MCAVQFCNGSILKGLAEDLGGLRASLPFPAIRHLFCYVRKPIM